MSIQELSMNSAALLSGIRDGNYHAGGIRCLQLLRLVEPYFGELRDEAVRLTGTESGSDVTHPKHITNWTRPHGEVVQFSLFNTSGRYEDFSSDHDLSQSGKRFLGAVSYPNLACLISAVPDLVNFRINLLGAGASLSPHEEHAIVRLSNGTVGARVRFHLPLVTDLRAELKLDGHVYHLAPGTVYFINHGCVHSACNGSDNFRIHLVWDVLLTHEAYKIMFGNATWSLPVVRIPEDQQTVTPTRTEQIGTYERIPPSVTRDEADGLRLCRR
jgi:Aspartyl/Asparaginyl beta-hydroxylase